ncbi:MAG: hypothetical protein V4662_25150 [Verrucomicrobiota bacterium]
MSLPDSRAFHHGKEARKNGLPCSITDARLAPSTRQDWYAGWNHQNALMMPQPSADVIDQNKTFLSNLADSVRASL